MLFVVFNNLYSSSSNRATNQSIIFASAQNKSEFLFALSLWHRNFLKKILRCENKMNTRQDVLYEVWFRSIVFAFRRQSRTRLTATRAQWYGHSTCTSRVIARNSRKLPNGIGRQQTKTQQNELKIDGIYYILLVWYVMCVCVCVCVGRMASVSDRVIGL